MTDLKECIGSGCQKNVGARQLYAYMWCVEYHFNIFAEMLMDEPLLTQQNASLD